jgi:O-antigen ligase
MTASLAAAVALRGGVYPSQWEWCALAAGVATLLWLLPAETTTPGSSPELAIMGALLAWILLQLAPLSPTLIGWLSPYRASAIAAARAATGEDQNAWVALSTAPALTVERLLDVIPAMAVFVAAREMGWRWRDRLWVAVAPVIGVAWIESVLGLFQFGLMRRSGGAAGPVSGSYANRDHFAGLLEIAFPLALMGAVAAWRNGKTSAALQASLSLAITASLLTGVVVSLSRMGFVSTAVAAGAAVFLTLLSFRRRRTRWWSHGLIPAAAVLLIALLPTRELSQRLEEISGPGQMSRDVRLEIWRNTLPLIRAYAWTGCGLGAYERGLYPFKTAAPTNTVDFAHNDYLQIVAELGLPGGALAGALALWIFFKPLAVVLKNRDQGNWELAAGLTAALLAFGVHSLADFNLYIPANALALAWLAGLAVSPGLAARAA